MAGAAGELFAVHYPVPAPEPAARAVLFVPPFAEEMNKSRRMFALLAQRLRDLGTASLLLDLFGTGDSRGDFGEARWEIWLDDLGRGAEYLAQQGHRVVDLVALRVGALLAAEFAPPAGCQLGRLVLWQPVVSGEAFLTQFLRLRMAATMMDGTAAKESTADLRKELAAGRPIEVGGYLLAPELAAAIEARSLAKADLSRTTSVHWIDVVADAGKPLSPASTRCVEALRAAGRTVTTRTVAGEAFWSTIEIATPTELLDATVEALSAERP